MLSTPLWLTPLSPQSRLRRNDGLAAKDKKRDHSCHQHPTNVASAIGNGIADGSVTIDEHRYGHDPVPSRLRSESRRGHKQDADADPIDRARLPHHAHQVACSRLLDPRPSAHPHPPTP